MKMVCPHCGLGGTAEDNLFGRMVRCPKCDENFRVSDDVIVDSQGEMPENGSTGSSEQASDMNESSNNLTQDVSTDVDRHESADGLGIELGECSVCGFNFSREFIKIIDGQPVCPACSG